MERLMSLVFLTSENLLLGITRIGFEEQMFPCFSLFRDLSQINGALKTYKQDERVYGP